MALEVEQTAFVQGDTLNATIEMNSKAAASAQAIRGPGNRRLHIGNLTVRTALRRGEFVVLGESARARRRCSTARSSTSCTGPNE